LDLGLLIIKHKIKIIIMIIIQKSGNIIYPRNLFCFRYIIANTLHKSDNKDNNNNNNNNNTEEQQHYIP
jgi:hypothetical protein